MRPADVVLEGGITEIFGRDSSGRTSLLIACLREVTSPGAFAALVDTDHAFDPLGAARAGVDLSRILWIRCERRVERALRATDWLVRCPGFALVALDTGAFTPRLSIPMAYRLKLAVLRTRIALVIVARHRITASGAALALRVSRREVEWAGPRPTPTRLDRVATALEVVRSQRVPELRPGAVLPQWWSA
jgi:hypothetical protein